MEQARFAELLRKLASNQVEFVVLEHAPEVSLGDALRVRVIDMPTLIQLKEEAGRPKDLAALPVLRATLDESERR